MKKIKIPGSNGPWGFLEVKDGRNYPQKAELTLGAALDFLIPACEAVEAQLSWEIKSGISKNVAALLYLYFNLPREKSNTPHARDYVGQIQHVIGQVREGFLAQKGNLLLKASDKKLVGMNMSGYVRKNILTGNMGHIHLELGKMIPADLSCGAPFFSLLLFHEATHHYCKTIDAIVKVPGKGKDMAYAKGTKSDILAEFFAAPNKKLFRDQSVGTLFSHIRPEEALRNADSLSWFLVNMIVSHNTALARARMLKGIWQDLSKAATAFEKAQRQVLPREMVNIEGFVTFFKLGRTVALNR